VPVRELDKDRPERDVEHGRNVSDDLGFDWTEGSTGRSAGERRDASAGRRASERSRDETRQRQSYDEAKPCPDLSTRSDPRVPLQPAPDEELPLHPEDAGEAEHHGHGWTHTPHVVVIHSPAEPKVPGRGFRVPVKSLIFLGLAAVGFYLVWPQLLDLWDAVPGLTTIKWFWFALMVAVEGGAFACYWGLMRITVREPSWFLIGTTQLASNAFTRIVPGGAASGGPLAYQMLVGGGAEKGQAVAGLTANTLLSNAVLFMLPVLSLPAILGGAPVSPSLLRALTIGVVLAVVIIIGGAVALFTDRALLLVGRAVRRVLNRVKKSGAPRDGLPQRLLEERDLIKEALGDKWWQALAFAAGNWLLDFGALLAALAGVGASPRPSLVLLGYVVAAILAWVPLTPGGLGFVEVGLAATLGLAGVGAAEATTAVLAYRLVSFWMPIPVGLVAGVLYRRRFGGSERAAAQGQA
jgi:uncharacterized protein (TIRG00374 family)